MHRNFIDKTGVKNPNIYIVKRLKKHGKENRQAFDFNKLHSSIKAACMSVRSLEGQADTTAVIVCMIINEWLKDKSEVTSQDLRRKSYQALDGIHTEAAYIYKNYQKII